MPGEHITFNDSVEDSANAPLELIDPENGVTIVEHSYPPPPKDSQWSSSADTEGDLLTQHRYKNREIALTVRIAEPQEAASTNLATNPKATVDTTGWTNTSLTTFERTVLGTIPRPTSAPFFDTAFHGVGNADLDRASDSVAVTSGQTYRFSAWVYLVSNSATGVRLRVRDAGGNVEASSSNHSTTGAWTRLNVSVAADATENWTFAVEQNAAGAVEFYFSAVLIENSASLGNYFDGDTIGCAWSGTRHDSTSTRPVYGGDRFYAMLMDLQKVIERVVREGGTLRRILPNGDPITFDLLDADVEIPSDNRFVHSQAAYCPIKLVAKPFGRGIEVTGSDNTQTTAPYLTFNVTGVKGDVPALGRLVIDEDDGDDQWWLVWGQQQRWYSSAASAALFFEAEDLTELSTTAVANGATGASPLSPGTNNVQRNTDLGPNYQAILSTEIDASNTHLSHIGSFRVFARLYRPTGNTGAVDVALEWAEGDFRRFTTNAPVSYAADEREGAFTIADLGQVHLTKTIAGTQRWEGRIIARSTVTGDEIDVDYLCLIPVDEGAGEVASVNTLPEPTAYSARSEFTTESGAITGDSAAVGGTWAGAGDANDFAESSDVLVRSDVSDTAARRITLPVSLTATAVRVDFKSSVVSGSLAAHYQGVVARRVDDSNYLYAYLDLDNDPAVKVRKVIAASATTLAEFSYPSGYRIPADTYFTLSLFVGANGGFIVWLNQTGSESGSPVLVGNDSALATGGTLAAGHPGIYDYQSFALAVTRTYDNFAAWVPSSDAAIFASQSIQIRHDRVDREDSGGTVWQRPGSYEGDYLLVPPAGPDNRTNRYIVKGCRADPYTMTDPAIDDISAVLNYTPRFRVIPEQ